MKQVIEEKKNHKNILRYSRTNKKVSVLPSLHYIKKKKKIGISDQKYLFFHSNISIRILHTLLYIYPLALTRRIRLTIKAKFPS